MKLHMEPNWDCRNLIFTEHINNVDIVYHPYLSVCFKLSEKLMDVEKIMKK